MSPLTRASESGQSPVISCTSNQEATRRKNASCMSELCGPRVSSENRTSVRLLEGSWALCAPLSPHRRGLLKQRSVATMGSMQSSSYMQSPQRMTSKCGYLAAKASRWLLDAQSKSQTSGCKARLSWFAATFLLRTLVRGVLSVSTTCDPGKHPPIMHVTTRHCDCPKNASSTRDTVLIAAKRWR